MRNAIGLFLIAIFSCVTYAAEPFPSLNIGYVGLPQRVTQQNLGAGIELFQLIRGQPSPYDYYTLSSGAVTEARARELVRQLQALGHVAGGQPLPEYVLHGAEVGVIVRTGRFDDFDAAERLKQKLHQAGITMAVRFTAEDGGPTSGPFSISILRVDLDRYRGEIIATLAQDRIPGKETVSSMAGRYRALAAVNAGFFALKPEVGTAGDPDGITVIDGKLVSEAVAGRPALVIRNSNPAQVRIAHNLTTKITLQLGTSKWNINGLNRRARMILNCGNQAAEPVTLPAHDFVCTNDNEIVLFDHHFGEQSEPGKGIEFSIDETGKVSAIRYELGGAIPQQGYLIQAQGNMAERFLRLVKIGMSASVRMEVWSKVGKIPLTKGLYIVNGGPTLLRKGRLALAARAKEGWGTDLDLTGQGLGDIFVDKKNTAAVRDQYSNNHLAFYHGWVLRRHPRTAVGLSRENVLYVVVVYGRRPGISAGASITDMANVLQSLGAEEALNLDGGGSSAMVVNGSLTGLPSDKTGERAVGDALVFIPASNSSDQ